MLMFMDPLFMLSKAHRSTFYYHPQQVLVNARTCNVTTIITVKSFSCLGTPFLVNSLMSVFTVDVGEVNNNSLCSRWAVKGRLIYTISTSNTTWLGLGLKSVLRMPPTSVFIIVPISIYCTMRLVIGTYYCTLPWRSCFLWSDSAVAFNCFSYFYLLAIGVLFFSDFRAICVLSCRSRRARRLNIR